VTQPSPLYRLIEEKLGRPLTGFIAERRATQTWPEIAEALVDETGIAVSSESVRNWFKDRIQIEVKVA
jgi:hypothetical protein